MKTFYGNQRRQFDIESHKINRKCDKIIANYITKNIKGNIIDIEESNEEKIINNNLLRNKKTDGYIYIGINKLFKTKDTISSFSDVKKEMKTQTFFYKINNRNNNNNKLFQRNISDNQIRKNENINGKSNIVNKFNKNISRNILLNSTNSKKDIIFAKIQQKLNNNNSSKFPYITKNAPEQEKTILQKIISNNNINNKKNNLNIHFHKLNQLHINFINSLKNKKDLNNEKELFDTNIKEKIIKKNKSQEQIIQNLKKHEEIDNNQLKKDRNTFKTIKKNFQLFYNKKKSINNRNKKSNCEPHNHSLKIEKKEIEINEMKKEESKTIVGGANINIFKNYIFSNPNKNKNPSYRSSKNMKISQDSEKTLNNEPKNLKSKINFKTSTCFFSPKFKKNFQKNSLNINEIINIAIENSIKARQAYMSSEFYNIGKNYIMNNKSRKIKKNFYSTSYERNWKREQAKEKINKENNKFQKNNFLNLFLLEPTVWEKHENIWMNIIKNLNEKNEIYILPPNDDDILISSYIKLFGKKSDYQNNIITININDENIKNPREEIKKWKIAYKNSLLRWHPDKLFSLLIELKMKNESIINDLRRRANVIINNINNTYQKIMEILNKILLMKNCNI